MMKHCAAVLLFLGWTSLVAQTQGFVAFADSRRRAIRQNAALFVSTKEQEDTTTTEEQDSVVTKKQCKQWEKENDPEQYW